MSSFKTGKFDKSSAGALKGLCPEEALNSILDIDPADLAARGKKLVLLDVDNTLLPWRSEEVPASSSDWIQRGREVGLSYCLISNTRNPARLERLANVLNVQALTGKFKPSRQMYLQAISDFGVTADQAVMVGDQLLTDIWGANRSGVEAIWVKPMAKREFVGTKFNRLVEWAVAKRLHSIIDEEDDDLPIVPKEGIFQKRIVRQFAKFCIVGGSSFIIDAGLHRLMVFHLFVGDVRLSSAIGAPFVPLTQMIWPGADAYHVGFGVAKTISASVAILNSFIWNRRWTFGIRGKEERARQLARFVLVSVIGLVLNVGITTGLNSVLPHDMGRRWVVATIVSAAVVAIWNFGGQRLWAFRRKT